MKKTVVHVVMVLLLTVICLAGLVQARESATDEACDGPVYSGKEVDRKARVLSFPSPEEPSDRRAADVRGTVQLKVVACHNGKITDIKVVTGLPYGRTEAAIKVARQVKFRPAEEGEVQVSQYILFEYKTPASTQE